MLDVGWLFQGRKVGVGRAEGSVLLGAQGGFFQFLKRKGGQEFLRRQIVVIAAVGPEQLGEVGDLGQRCRVDAFRMRHDFFEQTLLLQTVGGELVVNDGVDGDGSLRQPIGQCLLARRQRLEAGRVQLNEGGVADAFDEDVAGLFLLAECGGGDGKDREQ